MYIWMKIADEPMSDRHSIAEARRNLPALIREAENGKEVELTRRGEPVAMLISHRAFKHLTSIRRGFVAAYRDFTSTLTFLTSNSTPTNCLEMCAKRLGDAIFDCNQ